MGKRKRRWNRERRGGERGKRRWNRERRGCERGKEGGIGSGGDGKGEKKVE